MRIRNLFGGIFSICVLAICVSAAHSSTATRSNGFDRSTAGNPGSDPVVAQQEQDSDKGKSDKPKGPADPVHTYDKKVAPKDKIIDQAAPEANQSLLVRTESSNFDPDPMRTV